jgi:hypothetical protein
MASALATRSNEIFLLRILQSLPVTTPFQA